MASILEARGIRYSYPDGPEALRDLSLAIDEGTKITLVGPNGAGKSTLMLMSMAFSGYCLEMCTSEARF